MYKPNVCQNLSSKGWNKFCYVYTQICTHQRCSNYCPPMQTCTWLQRDRTADLIWIRGFNAPLRRPRVRPRHNPPNPRPLSRVPRSIPSPALLAPNLISLFSTKKFIGRRCLTPLSCRQLLPRAPPAAAPCAPAGPRRRAEPGTPPPVSRHRTLNPPRDPNLI